MCTDDSILAAAPRVLGGEHITKVEVGFELEATIQLSLDEVGTEVVASTTKALAALPPPQNALAIVLDTKVISAPTVVEAVTAGELQISGAFDRPQAEELARDIEVATPLPVDLI